jgi:purine-binding chemotaxis protein CheW
MKLATEETYLLEREEQDLGPQRAVLTFVVAGEIYGVDLVSIREIIKLGQITEVPRAPAFVLGVTSVRGAIIPVIDLRLRLRLDALPSTRAARILVVNHESDPFGVLVDAVRGVMRFGEAEIQAPPSTLAADDAKYLSGIARQGVGRRERMVILLQLSTVLYFDFGGRHKRRERESP